METPEQVPQPTSLQVKKFIDLLDEPFPSAPCHCECCKSWRNSNYYSERSRLQLTDHLTIMGKIQLRLENSLKKKDAVKYPLPKL